jgi:drug/metabolite transporter (DMT)-like permease
MPFLLKIAPLAFLLMWSSGAIFVKLGLEHASVWAFLTVRSVGSAVLIFCLCILMKGRSSHARFYPGLPTIAKIMGVGVLLQVFYQSFFFLSIDFRLSPGALAIILGLQPILTPIIAREAIGFRRYCVLLIGLSGLAMAVAGARETGSVTLSGVICGLVAVAGISVGTVLQKRLEEDVLTCALYQNLATAIVFAALLPIVPWYINPTPVFIVSALWMIIVVSTMAVLLLFLMLSRQAASQVGVLFYLVPVVTLALDYLVFGTKLSLMTLCGAALVVLAIKLFTRQSAAGPADIIR